MYFFVETGRPAFSAAILLLPLITPGTKTDRVTRRATTETRRANTGYHPLPHTPDSVHDG